MTKHEKRLQKARNNPKSVSYQDFVSILEKEGYTLRDGKGSHQKVDKVVGTTKFNLTFAVPHGKKKTVDTQAVKDLLAQLNEITILEAPEESENHE
jgi:predicted RNA binding protein YcfA (HicA-like mRNA interferase family)